MASINQKLLDELVAHSIFTDRYGKTVARKIIKMLIELDPVIEAHLLKVMGRLDENRFTVKRLQSELKTLRDLLEETYKAMFAALDAEMGDLSEVLGDKQLALLSNIIPDDALSKVPLIAIPANQIYSAATAKPFQGRLLKEWADTLAEGNLTKIANAIQAGFLTGQTTQQIVQKVMGTKANKYKDGILEINRRNATMIVRTAVSHYASTARDKMFSENKDYIKGQVWCSTLDTRTSPTCIARDGKEYTLKGEPIGHDLPYLGGAGRAHIGCRSTMVPILKSWKEMGFDFEEMKPSTRSSMDGQVPEDTKYSDWLQRQSFERQVQVLGKERALLIQDGVTVEKMFTDNGEFLTLEQLKKIL